MEELSSKLTVFYKFIFPTMWIGMFSLGTLLMFVAPDSFEGDGDIREMRRFFLGATVVGSVFIYWACMRVKRVQLAGKEFIISNYRKTIRIPVRDVERVSSSVLLNPELIWLHLRRPSDFGSRIVFMPRQRFFGGYSRNPVATRLDKLLTSPDVHA